MNTEGADRRISRRRLLQGGGALVAVAGAGGVGYDLAGSRSNRRSASGSTTTSAASASSGATVEPRFQSRPDLQPPRLKTARTAKQLAPGAIFLTPATGAAQPGTLIADDDGEPIWFRPLPAGVWATNLRVQQYRGQPVLTWWEGVITGGWGRGEVVIADSSYRELARVSAGNGLAPDLHDFTLTPQGTALVTVYHPTRGDLSSLGGPSAGYVLDSGVQEIDVATGDVRFEWMGSRNIPMKESVKPLGSDGTSRRTPFDPYHVNSVAADADGDLLVSIRHLSAVVKIGRADGRLRWRLGGKRSDFRFGPGADFGWQHDAVRRPDGSLTVFDNGGSADEEQHPSRGITLRIDEKARTASLVRSLSRRSRTVALSQGNFQVLPDGGSFVGWGEKPYFTGFDHAGAIALEGRFVESTNSYRAFRDPWTGTPPDRPAVATRPRADGGTDVFASWNGATAVARWDVLAGSSTESLHRAASVARRGFETSAELAGRPTFIAAVALDHAGQEIGRSAPLRA